MAISLESLDKEFGWIQYFMAVILYYRTFYDQALQYVNEAMKYLGYNRNLISLKGHCLFALHDEKRAKEEYYHVLSDPNNPADLPIMNLVYLNCSQILENDAHLDEARNVALFACKYFPSPNAWLTAARLYYLVEDYNNAETCLEQANRMDNGNALIWGYLALLNSKLKRFDEAEICFQETIKNGLADVNLLKTMENELQKCKNQNEGVNEIQ